MIFEIIISQRFQIVLHSCFFNNLQSLESQVLFIALQMVVSAKRKIQGKTFHIAVNT